MAPAIPLKFNLKTTNDYLTTRTDGSFLGLILLHHFAFSFPLVSRILLFWFFYLLGIFFPWIFFLYVQSLGDSISSYIFSSITFWGWFWSLYCQSLPPLKFLDFFAGFIVNCFTLSVYCLFPLLEWKLPECKGLFCLLLHPQSHAHERHPVNIRQTSK